jgi:ectoine hydroxylase-related dioxygenase (phytanoyl-CoA dioxygenase family)
MSATLAKPDIDSHYKLSDEQIHFFRTQGYIKLKQVLSPEALEYYGREISRKVIELNTLHIPMEQRSTYQKAFLQIMNIWTKSEIVKDFVFSKRLARIAAELMGVSGVRLYHDQALYKEAGGGITPWHADQYYWPLESHNTCTVWIPLQETPLDLGPLAFAPETQKYNIGRELEISDDSEKELAKMLRERNFKIVEEPFDLGEVSYHYGWTFHRAGENKSKRAREVMTVIYMEEGMRLSKPKNKNQQNDWDTWCPGAKIGEVVNTPINPVIWSSK